MACHRGVCAAEKVFVFINIAFAMYSGAMLATAARLAWDPSTYTWFRFLCAAQYRVSCAYVLAAGLWLAALVYLAAATRYLHLYAAGVACLAVSEVAYGAWMVTSLVEWWRTSPQAELARHGMDVMHDMKKALLAVDRYRDVAQPVYDMMEEVERQAPNNAYVIVVFGLLGTVLQVAAFVMACRMARRAHSLGHSLEPACAEKPCVVVAADDESDTADPPPGWRKRANLGMYTILDKIF